MLDLEQIQAISRDAAKEAAKEGKIPFVVWQEDLQDIPPFPFPFLGDYVPAGWQKVEEYFVDSTGFGTQGEAALTISQFLEKITPGHGYAITQSGEFQVKVGEYVKVGEELTPPPPAPKGIPPICRGGDTLYQHLDSLLQGRCALSRKWGKNTYLKRLAGEIALLLHETFIVKVGQDGAISLFTGGWLTPTTKDRINSILPSSYAVYQKNRVWHLTDQTNDWLFKEGITISPDGTVTHYERGDIETKLKDLKKKCREYAKLCASKIPIPQPSGGDCWYCHMGIGDEFKDHSHILEHIKEGYVVPTLVYKALEQHHNSKMAFWQAFKDSGYPEGDREHGRHAVEKAVYEYTFRRLRL